MCAIEWGKCEICGKETQLERTYFRYPIDCTCCGGHHFVIVRHCAECIPKIPNNITLSLKGTGGLPLNVRICGLMPYEIEGKFYAVKSVGISKEETTTEDEKHMNSMNEFSKLAMSTLTQSCDNFTYALSGMVAEVGEINDKVAKWRRKGEAFIKDDELVFNTTKLEDVDKFRNELALEVFDVMWFCALMARKLGLSLQEVSDMGLAKLSRRAQTGTIITHKDH